MPLHHQPSTKTLPGPHAGNELLLIVMYTYDRPHAGNEQLPTVTYTYDHPTQHHGRHRMAIDDQLQRIVLVTACITHDPLRVCNPRYT